jgi:aminoglycoside/choline kinase family phosphotransferase
MEKEYAAYALEILGLSGQAREGMAVRAVLKGGSDRRFYRLSFRPGKSVLFMAYGKKQEENGCWAEIAAFLAALGVPVPAVYGHDPERGFVVMEDLGKRDLWSYRRDPWEVRRDLYRKVLNGISPLHAFSGCPSTSGAGEGPLRLSPPLPRMMKGYDSKLYRWEHNYFLDQYVRDFCGISLTEREGTSLREELEALSGRLLAAGTSIVHRDLQSQNIMIRGGEPVFIDFQGLRRGSLFYDLGSLLCDPYVTLGDEERDDLLRHAYDQLQGEFDWTRFRECFVDGSAQRLMQALGAFGFLGLKKGKTAFLDHIPQGIANLCRMAAAAGRLPRLLHLAERCRESRGAKNDNRRLD